MVLPLSGLSVLEAVAPTSPPALHAAAALCGRVAADLGARVTRWLPPDDTTAPHPFLDIGKQALRGPLDTLLPRLLADADAAVIDSALAASGQARQATASLSMTADGDTQQSEFTIEALSGLLDIVGAPDRSPLRLGGHQTAYAAGLAAFTGLLAGLSAPMPLRVAVTMLDTAVWLNWKGLAMSHLNGKAPHRAGALAEWPVLACADGHIALVHRPQEWERMLAAFPDPALQAAAFRTAADRRANRAALNAILARNVAPLTRTALHALALRHKLPFGVVLSPDELREDRQMLARHFFRPPGTEGAGLPRLPVLWNGQQPGGASA